MPIKILYCSQNRFHSFEVGFGRKLRLIDNINKEYCFHSFEVGFGLEAQEKAKIELSSFHSFEVGFGHNLPENGWEKVSAFSFLRGRLRTWYRNFRHAGIRRFSFLRGRLRTLEIGDGVIQVISSFHSFEVGFGPEYGYFDDILPPCFHSFEVGFGQQI